MLFKALLTFLLSHSKNGLKPTALEKNYFYLFS